MSFLEKHNRNLRRLSVSKMDLIDKILEETSKDHDKIELVISLKEKAINIKELSSYLDVIYKFDAHLSEIGFLSYIHHPHLQIEIDEIRLGSWEIVFERLLGTEGANRIIIIFLALKFLPNTIKAASDTIYRYYETLDKREDYLEKKHKRKQRKEIRNLINQESKLSNLDKHKKEKLVDIIDKLYEKSEKKLVSAARLAEKSVNKIILKSKKS